MPRIIRPGLNSKLFPPELLFTGWPGIAIRYLRRAVRLQKCSLRRPLFGKPRKTNKSHLCRGLGTWSPVKRPSVLGISTRARWADLRRRVLSGTRRQSGFRHGHSCPKLMDDQISTFDIDRLTKMGWIPVELNFKPSSTIEVMKNKRAKKSGGRIPADAVLLIPEPEAPTQPAAYGIKPGYYNRVQLIELLDAHKTEPDSIRFIADMLETGDRENDGFAVMIRENCHDPAALSRIVALCDE